ncbi:unnamed protein product [Coregonus sp. 'balchen']|nr:unnamed protein product [Coregonus sp. 'balchen']
MRFQIKRFASHILQSHRGLVEHSHAQQTGYNYITSRGRMQMFCLGKWTDSLRDGQSRLPGFATHQIGVAVFLASAGPQPVPLHGENESPLTETLP